ncbi:MAG: zf-HC2 domain-containing protein, partial [Candidatus Krumholzibacteriia bacterium]
MNERCADLELELAGFAAGELEPALADRVARHLAACAACRSELERELRLREALGALPVAAAPAGLGALPPAGARTPFRFRLAPSLGGLAAAAALVALLAGLPGGQPPLPVDTPHRQRLCPHHAPSRGTGPRPVRLPPGRAFDDPYTIETLDWYAGLIHNHHIAPTEEEAYEAFGGAAGMVGALATGVQQGKVVMWP